jgi:hypothetical protein
MAHTDGLHAIYGEVSRDGKVTLTIDKIYHFGGRGYERHGYVVGLAPYDRSADNIFRVAVKRVRTMRSIEGVRKLVSRIAFDRENKMVGGRVRYCVL